MSKLFHTDSVWRMCPECNGVVNDDQEPECDKDTGLSISNWFRKRAGLEPLAHGGKRKKPVKIEG